MEVIDDLNEAVDLIAPAISCFNHVLDLWEHGFGFLIAAIPTALFEDHEHLLIESGRGQTSSRLLVIGKGIEDRVIGEGFEKRR